MGGIFDLFDGMCKQLHWTVLNPFLNGTKNGDINGMCKPGFISWKCGNKYQLLLIREELKKESRRLKKELLESRKQKDEKQKETNDSGKTDNFVRSEATYKSYSATAACELFV